MVTLYPICTTMNTKYTATLAAMLAVPALVVSCDGRNYSTPEGFFTGQIKLLKDFTEAAKACYDDNIADMETALKELIETQKLLAKGVEGMTPEQQAEISRKLRKDKSHYGHELEEVGEALNEAMKALDERLGHDSQKKLKPLLDEWRAARRQTLKPLRQYRDMD